MKNIIVPTDFSSSSLAALKYACKLAVRLEANIFLMHCCELMEERYHRYKILLNDHNNTVVSKIYQKLKKLQKSMEMKFGIKPEICLYENADVLDSILYSIKDRNIDLVVMGSYGEQGLRRKFFGSKPASVINKSPVPVITVPPGYKWREQNEFIICVDDLIEDVETIKPFFEIARVYSGKVFVAIFSDEVDADCIIETKITKYLKQKVSRVYPSENIEVVHLAGANFFKSVRKFIIEKKIDLLSMVTYKRNLFEQIFDRSMTQKMSYQTIVPLLSLKKTKVEDISSW